MDTISLSKCLKNIIDNRGKTCPTSDKGIPLIATNCIKEESIYPTFENVRYVSEETYSNWFKGHPSPGDIIFVNKGTPGRVCLVPDPINFCIAQDMVALQVDESVIYPPYLFAALRSRQVRKSIENMHVGTMIPHFKKGDFDLLEIPLPKKSIQIYIGNFYRTFSEKILLNKQTNESLEEIAKALFKSWFIDFDPTRAKAEGLSTELPKEISNLFPDSFEDSELGAIPSGWHVSVIGNIAENFDRKRIPLSKAERAKRKGYFPYFGATGIFDYINDFLFDGVYLLIGEDGSVEKENGTAFTQYVKGKIWVNNHAHVITGIDPISTEFLYCFFQFFKINPYISGAVQLKLSQGRMNMIPIPIADNNCLKIFDQIVKPIFSKITIKKSESLVIESIRDTLLPKLISGELRVTEAEKMIQEVSI